MNIKETAKIIANNIINNTNEENLSWNDVYKKEINKLDNKENLDKTLLLMNIVKEISRQGYSIEDNPFRLTKY